MKQQVLDWYNRNKFHYWQIENSKGKVIAVNTAGKAGKNPDEGGQILGVELTSLESLNLAERYSIAGMEKNGDTWQYFPFQTYASMPNNAPGNGGFGIEMAMMLGRMQAEQTTNQLIWQLQQEKAERERKEQETSGLGEIIKMIKPLAPALLSSAAPLIFKGVFDLAGKSPQILALLEKVTANPAVQEGITQMVTNYFTNQQNGTASTGLGETDG